MADFDPNTAGSSNTDTEGRAGGGGLFWNILTVLALVGIIVVIGWFAIVFENPYAAINPFPPPTLPVPIVLPSATPTVPQLPPTWTPGATDTAVPTFTPVPSYTATLSKTDIAAQGPTATKTERPVSNYSFDLQSMPTGIDAAVLYPERGCNWLGVGGQVVDMQGRPVTGITVQVGGNLGRQVVDQTSLTGLALKYGEAGYEFELAKAPVTSKQNLWVRLIDQARLPLSPKVYFDTYEDCQRNLVVINFRQVR
ncbi:MAG: hypothetical protein IT308_10750 [Anaerolineaceae bacterium]|nr:hypothetical protein [Anaerolineaceae bacterium]